MSTIRSSRPPRARARSGGARSLLSPGLAVGLALAMTVLAPPLLAQQSQEAPPTQEEPPTQGEPPPASEAEAPPPGEAEAPPALDLTERQFQDWVLRCGRSEQGPEVCEMQQQTTDSEGRTIMAVAVGTVPGTSDVGLLIILPLGILLPPGVSLQIDGGAEVPLEVERCERQGCRIEKLVEPALLNRLKGGREAKVFFEAYDPEGELQRLGVPISLLGFTAALSEIVG